MQNLVRLQKYIADCGVTSRRKAEDLISRGLVKVGDEVISSDTAKKQSLTLTYKSLWFSPLRQLLQFIPTPLRDTNTRR